jgi:hypothetical protein
MAKRKKARRRSEFKRLFWVRLGDVGNYESFIDPFAAAQAIGEYLAEAGMDMRARIFSVHSDMGIVVDGFFEGNNYISVYWGDKEAQPVVRQLAPWEMSEFIADISDAAFPG